MSRRCMKLGGSPVSRFVLLVSLACLCSIGMRAQDWGGIQFHGFATQGFLYSTHNNYLSAQTSSGSLQWTHGAISVTDSLTDNLRVGIQLHMYQLGQLGGPNIMVDWASGDYSLNDRLGFRAGKVKTVFGLYNDSQDIDAIFLWSLLPECTYAVDNESFYLSHLGGDVYGRWPLGKGRGKLRYNGFVGHVALDLNGGYLKQFADAGVIFTTPPSGKTYGGDLRWEAPLTGLTLGASIDVEGLDGSAPAASLHIAPFQITAEYAQFSRGKWNFAGQYTRAPFLDVITSAEGVLLIPVDSRAWFAMASYRVSKRLQVGSYYGHYVNQAADTSLPDNHSKDWALSMRHDFNSYFYAKIEDHFMHGTGLGYYQSTNPNGLQPDSNILAAKIGFSF